MTCCRYWIQLFKEGKWSDCAHAIQEELNDLSLKGVDFDHHAKRISLENNMFVCEQLGANWDREPEENISQKWASSFSKISEQFRFLRCQLIGDDLPLDLVLCAAYNCMWWAVMKVDPLHQHFCQREALDIAIYCLKAVGKALGNSPWICQSTGHIEREFIRLSENSFTYLSKLTPIQCHLALEIITLGFVAILDGNQPPTITDVVDHIVDMLPQIKVHLTLGNSKEICRKNQELLKFGWKDVGNILGAPNTSIFEVLLIVITISCLRNEKKNMKENSKQALRYLSLIDKSSLLYPFLYNYLCGLANFNLGNLDSCLYYLQSTSLCSSNFFMQGRCNILKGQALLHQDRPAEALEALHSVQYKRKEVRIPFCAYLMAKSYQKLGKVKRQTEVLDLLIECLSTEPVVQPTLLSPLSGMEYKLLLSVHSQPEISYKEVLQYSARALIPDQPKKAAEKLLQLLHVISIEMEGVMEDSASCWTISELLHDTASALLRAHSPHDAQEICEVAVQFHESRFDLASDKSFDFSTLEEDVIALMLLAEANDSLGCPNVFEILNRCGKVLQNLFNKFEKSSGSHEKIIKLSKALLARVFVHKASLNVKRKFDDDATACFQRALYWNNEDPEAILKFSCHLLDNNQLEESLALWRMYTDCAPFGNVPDSIALNYILGEKMDSSERKKILGRLESLSSSV